MDLPNDTQCRRRAQKVVWTEGVSLGDATGKARIWIAQRGAGVCGKPKKPFPYYNLSGKGMGW